jgi:HTH-type transcriptional regulator/antitoxin HigA
LPKIASFWLSFKIYMLQWGVNIIGEFRTPGQLIQALLDSRGWTQRILAIVLRVDETVVSKIIAGRRTVDASMALLLFEVFNVPAERFLQLQQQYDLAKARIITQSDPARATRAVLFGDLPVTDMIKRGWLDAQDIRDVTAVEKSLVKFFGVGSLDEIEILPHAAKKTHVNTPATPAQIAWLYRVREIANEMIVPRYSRALGEDAVRRLRPLLSSPEEARKVPRVLAESGIRFALVESLPSAKIDGVCFWLSDTSPVIALSMRYDRIDNFWFVLRHELEHVLREHGGAMTMLDTELEGERAGYGMDIPGEERVANVAAADFCVPSAKLKRFIARKAPFFAERDILGFANTLGVHPGLVAGQLQHLIGRFDRFRTHLVKIRSAVAPSAFVDGWGDIAPVGI